MSDAGFIFELILMARYDRRIQFVSFSKEVSIEEQCLM